MSLKKTKGNMYEWVTHTHTHMGGECPHKCIYCYVDNPRFGRHEKYSGELRLIEKEFSVKYGEGKTIFMENCNDMFAREVPDKFILRILQHCRDYLHNMYVFQTKNPARYLDYLKELPDLCMLGTTIETNRKMDNISKAPDPCERAHAMGKIISFQKFVTIEPVLDFDISDFISLIILSAPSFINIGADSKDRGLKEPSKDQIFSLVQRLKTVGIEVREKHNLDRLKNK